jgi:hypothetical protein
MNIVIMLNQNVTIMESEHKYYTFPTYPHHKYYKLKQGLIES